jgi:alkylhydroperoxidase family enzyme
VERARVLLAGRPVQTVNLRATLVVNRAVFDGMSPLYDALLQSTRVDGRDRELVILRMASRCEAKYVFAQHRINGRAAGLTGAEIVATTQPPAAAPWSTRDHLLLDMTDELYADDCITDETWRGLHDIYSDADLIELMAIAGTYRMTGAILNSCGVQLEDGVAGWPGEAT